MNNKFKYTVTRKEWLLALMSWNSIMNVYGFDTEYASFYQFLGNSDFQNIEATYEIHLTEAAFNKVRMLNSPHARTLLKAFAARTGYQRHIP